MKKIKQIMASMMSVAMLASPFTALAANTENFSVEDNTLTIERVFTASASDADFPDLYTYKGADYQLTGVSTEVLQTIVPDTKTFTYLSPEVEKESDLEEIPETMEQNNETYTLKSKELVSEHVEGSVEYKTKEVSYSGIENDKEIPSYTEIAVTDENGGEMDATIPLIDRRVDQEVWADTFSFPIRFSNYDADSFLLAGTSIPKDADLMDYSDAFLAFLGLSGDYYKIDSIEWDGDEYVENGILCRNAVANGQKYVKDITGFYGGNVVVGEHDIYYYNCIYEKAPDESEYSYEIKAVATYELIEEEPVIEEEKKNIVLRILDWMKENPVAAIGIGTLTLAVIIVLILFVLTRKKREDDRTEFIDIDKRK